VGLGVLLLAILEAAKARARHTPARTDRDPSSGLTPTRQEASRTSSTSDAPGQTGARSGL
jgi:hypothetical protein